MPEPIVSRDKLLKICDGDQSLASLLEKLFSQAYRTDSVFDSITDNGLTPNQSVRTNESKMLVSLGDTGSGLNVLSESPEFTGSPSVPDVEPLASDETIANTRYVDNAVAIEQERAESAEANKQPVLVSGDNISGGNGVDVSGSEIIFVNGNTFWGTGAPPDPAGLAEGSRYFRYVP